MDSFSMGTMVERTSLRGSNVRGSDVDGETCLTVNQVALP